MIEDRKKLGAQLMETIKANVTKGYPSPSDKAQHTYHKANAKSLRRNEQLEDKKKKIASKVSIYKQHAQKLHKLEKRGYGN